MIQTATPRGVTPIPAVRLVAGNTVDRAAIMRVRAPRDGRPFVHHNWFWLDRALADPEIRFRLIRRPPRGGLAGVVAFGPHEAVDLDPSSRQPDIGEIYHIVVGQSFAGCGIGLAAVRTAAAELAAAYPAQRALRIGHNPRNAAAAAFFGRLGFKRIGGKSDGETGESDILLELSGGALRELIGAEAVTSPPRAS